MMYFMFLSPSEQLLCTNQITLYIRYKRTSERGIYPLSNFRCVLYGVIRLNLYLYNHLTLTLTLTPFILIGNDLSLYENESKIRSVYIV